MEDQVQTQRVIGNQEQVDSHGDTGQKSQGFIQPPKILSQRSYSSHTDNKDNLSQTDVSIHLNDDKNVRKHSNFPYTVEAKPNMNILQQAIEFTCDQLSWKKKTWCGRIYLILGYLVYIAFSILLIIITYYATRGTDQMSRYRISDKMTKVLDMTNVTRMIYILKNNPSDIQNQRMSESPSKLTFKDLWTLPNIGGSIFNDIHYEGDKGDLVSLQNNLEHDITMLKLGKRLEKNVLYDYPLAQLKNIRNNVNDDDEDDSPDVFVNINMLVTFGVKHADVNYLYSVMQED